MLQAVLSQRKNVIDVSSVNIDTINVKNTSLSQLEKAKNKSIYSIKHRWKRDPLIASVFEGESFTKKCAEAKVNDSPKVLAVVSRFDGGKKQQRLIKETIKNAERQIAHELKDW